jgi:hypothetical protein
VIRSSEVSSSRRPRHQFWRLGDQLSLPLGPIFFDSRDRALMRGGAESSLGERTQFTMYRLRWMGLFGGYMQFSVRSYNPEEGQERTGHVTIRAPNEHRLHFGKLRVQFVHRDLAVSPSRGHDAFW